MITLVVTLGLLGAPDAVQKGTDSFAQRVTREHWAFQPLQAIRPPEVEDTAWVRTSIDRFIGATLESRGLRPTPAVSPRKVIRRICLDVTGLPPTPREVDEFLAAAAGDRQAAVAALVDRLLEGRHYGERWGRHWLDVARYADSDGQEADRDRPNAYHYRDFVIRALNDDLPFDTFVRWQLAGDEYEPKNPLAVAATGFLVGGPHTVLEETFLEEERLRNRYNELDDMLSTLGVGLLGLTLGCARCHDHKYDAVSSREYYRMLSALHSGDRAEVPLQAAVEPAKDSKEFGGPKALAFRDFGATPRETWLFERGDFRDRDEPVALGFVDVLTRGKTAQDYWGEARKKQPLKDSTYQRRALADWITDLENGAGALAARVIVNRVWQHHFGKGLVRTVSDFGVRGQSPSHPELLEWLARDLVEHGWKLKRLHRLILTSAVYQQGTKFDADKVAVDPDNRLLWRRRPRRLEAEVLRDAMLRVSGTLNLEPFGPAFKPPISSEAMTARNLQSEYPDKAKDEPATRRRSVYMFHKRVIPYPLLQAFDRPDLLQSCGRREQTTVAPQALALLNDEFVRARAVDFANRLLEETGEERGDHRRLVERAFQLALSRPPSESEQAASVAFIESQIERRTARDPKQPVADPRRQALADYCQTLFGLNEFLYVD